MSFFLNNFELNAETLKWVLLGIEESVNQSITADICKDLYTSGICSEVQHTAVRSEPLHELGIWGHGPIWALFLVRQRFKKSRMQLFSGAHWWEGGVRGEYLWEFFRWSQSLCYSAAAKTQPQPCTAGYSHKSVDKSPPTLTYKLRPKKVYFVY